MSDPLDALRVLRKSRVWFYRPQWYWYGRQTLLPFDIGHDEFSRETLTVGWTVTGRIIIPFRYCGDVECYEQSLRWAADV